MTMDEIRQFLLYNTRYYSDKNETKIEDIKSQYKYYFISDCGHEFYSFPKNVIKNYKISCPVCSGRQVVKGVNDIWTTDPDIAELLLNPEDGYKYTIGSNQKLEWLCPDCNTILSNSPNKMKINVSKCKYCNKIRSYGEKFITELLNQLCEGFIPEKTFDWSDGKIYDFYLPFWSCIIEVHGKQHYSSSDFSGFGGKTYIEEQLNDEYKKELALNNGMNYYIVIENMKSDKEILTNNILCSLLPTILNFEKEDIDWDKCHEFCMTSRTVDICRFYENESKNLKTIAEHFGCCVNTVKNHLNKGAILGYCSYCPKESRAEAQKKIVQKMIERTTKPIIQMSLNNEYIAEFSSIQLAQRELNISHIWDCLVGKRNSAGGFKWRYKGDTDLC